METIALVIVLIAKIVADITLGKKALDQVKKLSDSVDEMSRVIDARFSDHEVRIKRMEGR
jgi:hypothetical protein